MRQWKTEEPGILQSMGLQRVRHDLAAEKQQQQAVSREFKCLSVFCKWRVAIRILKVADPSRA